MTECTAVKKNMGCFNNSQSSQAVPQLVSGLRGGLAPGPGIFPHLHSHGVRRYKPYPLKSGRVAEPAHQSPGYFSLTAVSTTLNEAFQPGSSLRGNPALAFKATMIILFLLLFSSILRGQESFIITGQILIPGPIPKKPYTFKVSLAITREKIEIRCIAKIFRLFNAFKDPMQYKLLIDTEEVDKIKFHKERLYIFPTMTLYHLYRNLFFPMWESKITFGPDLFTMEYQVLAFHLDNPQVANTGASLIAVINDRAEKLRKKHGHRGTGKYVD